MGDDHPALPVDRGFHRPTDYLANLNVFNRVGGKTPTGRRKMGKDKSTEELIKELEERNKEIRAELAERRTEELETSRDWVFRLGKGGGSDEK